MAIYVPSRNDLLFYRTQQSISVFLLQVDIEINGVTVDLKMKLGDGGTAYFVQEADALSEVLDDIIIKNSS